MVAYTNKVFCFFYPSRERTPGLVPPHNNTAKTQALSSSLLPHHTLLDSICPYCSLPYGKEMAAVPPGITFAFQTRGRQKGKGAKGEGKMASIESVPFY